MIALAVMVHGILGSMLTGSLDLARSLEWKKQGLIEIPSYLKDNLERLEKARREIATLKENSPDDSPPTQKKLEDAEANLEREIEQFAKFSSFQRSRQSGQSEEAARQEIAAQFRSLGSEGFVVEKDDSEAVWKQPAAIPPSAWVFSGFVLLWWIAMLICQGEGLEVDIQRRRHPLWEWLFSHPVRPIAAFSAEMLAPLAANPIYLTAPVFWFVVFLKTHSSAEAIAGALLVGLPFAVAASCLNKSIEIAAMLRLSPRRRGAVLGLFSWAGYVAMLVPLFTLQLWTAKMMVMKWLAPLASFTPFTWPGRVLLVGWSADGAWWEPAIIAWVGMGCLFALAFLLAWRGVARGLQGIGGDTPSSRRSKSGSSFLSGSRSGNPLYRKELLWLWRDKAAVVQVVLIPLTIGALQAFNLRGVAQMAASQWNLLCGLAILCGTYFLLVLGPRSLLSEGGALWIALTWPRGLEDLLKAKARLWWWFSMTIVGGILVAGMFLFPADWWRILLVALGWTFFSHALAEKSVTLVTAPSSSGEPEPAPKGRQFIAMLGTLAFGAGVLTKTWHAAMLGVVFSSLTAAAMWQTLRARLPHLFDPWSEKLPPAPTILHAMVGIALMGEVVAVLSGVVHSFGGSSSVWLVHAIGYGVVGFFTWAGMTLFLESREVRQKDLWRWTPGITRTVPQQVGDFGSALVAGLGLGGVALLYLTFLRHWGPTEEMMQKLDEVARNHSEALPWLLLLSVGLAPVAEEFLFRGLLYRSLEREWKSWRAMVGSAAYFAIYHPPVSWLPVFGLGLLSAFLFKRTGRLWACVVLHATYNLVVILGGN
ncbi:MAG: CPBP family intramembrane metalloprotease [Verrucomicrobiae bacterium]|nr:CPBP family intramembrane metalloprotease [Verrucomicrobiae bacterium]